MEEMQVIEVNGMRVLTTRQISLAYKVTEKLIWNNFTNNKSRYTEGKHYIHLVGEELKDFLHSQNLGLQNQSKVRHLYLWTEKGALLHAKSLNTDKAWEVYDYLVDFYFRVKEASRQQDCNGNAVVPIKVSTEPIPEGIEEKKEMQVPEMVNPIGIFNVLYRFANISNIKIKSVNFKSKSRSLLYGDRIGIRTHMELEEVNYEIAYELAHAILHYNVGDMINSKIQDEYNERANRAAVMIIKMLDMSSG